MATTNPFDLLGDDDNDDVSQLVQKLPPPVSKSTVAAQSGGGAAAQPEKSAKLPSKPVPPSQAVRESRSDGQRGGGRSGGRGSGRGRGGRFSRDSADNDNAFSSNYGFSRGYRQPEEGDSEKSSERRGYGGPRGSPRGGRRGGFSNGEVTDGERPRRVFERHSGTGRGNEYSKRDGAGKGNWGTPADEIAPENEEQQEPINVGERNVDAEKQPGQENVGDASKENPVTESEEKPEDKEMTLEEYEKVLEEKRKALLALKSEERKVDLDKDFERMQLLSSKKNEEEIFVKPGSDKDKRKEAEKEEKARKALSINEFLKPADGERYYGRGRGRGRDRDHGARGDRDHGARGGYGRNAVNNVVAPAIEDQRQFPTLGAK